MASPNQQQGGKDGDPLLRRFKNSIVRHGTDGDPSQSEEGPHQQIPRNSCSSQSSSSASPLTRIEATPGQGRGRRLSPSRLSGGSFDVAVNYGMNMTMSPPINNQLLSIYLPNMSQNKNLISPTLSPSGNSSSNYDPNINISSPQTSCPTTPSSPPAEESTLQKTSIVVQVHETS